MNATQTTFTRMKYNYIELYLSKPTQQKLIQHIFTDGSVVIQLFVTGLGTTYYIFQKHERYISLLTMLVWPNQIAFGVSVNVTSSKQWSNMDVGDVTTFQ